MRYDLVLLHPPAVYDFRRMPQFRGPISDVIPSTTIFDMYPIGLTSIAEYLERQGLRVRIVNLAVRMLHQPGFDVEAKLRQLDAAAFGVSLHWLPHVQGSLEIARLLKRHHPGTPVIFGGLSATYFHAELIANRDVDFVVRGDSTERAMARLMREILGGRGHWAGVPDLAWKDRGHAVVNPLTPPAEDLDEVTIPAYGYAIRSVLRDRCLWDVMPYQGWLGYPLTALLTTRGCSRDCSVCGGSRSAYALACGRRRPAMRSPARLIEDLRTIQRFSRSPVFVIGDIRQGGAAYVDELLQRLAALRPKNELVFELFWEADGSFFERLQRAVPRHSLEITLESAEEAIRRDNGKFPCSNDAVLATLQAALAHGCGKLDIFFMTGLPRQTPASALANVDFCETIHRACGGDRRLCYFVAPLAPFLDPGSRAFEHPEQFGVRRLATTLAEHRALAAAPSWEFMLNYETETMNRRQMVETLYASLDRLNDFKLRHGQIAPAAHARYAEDLRVAMAHLARVREAVGRGAALPAPPDGFAGSRATERTHRELRWKLRHRWANPLQLARLGLELLREPRPAHPLAAAAQRPPRVEGAEAGHPQLPVL